MVTLSPFYDLVERKNQYRFVTIVILSNISLVSNLASLDTVFIDEYHTKTGCSTICILTGHRPLIALLKCDATSDNRASKRLNKLWAVGASIVLHC